MRTTELDDDWVGLGFAGLIGSAEAHYSVCVSAQLDEQGVVIPRANAHTGEEQANCWYSLCTERKK